MKNKSGLLALIGLGAGAFAWWKYRNMTPEQKAELKGKVNDAGNKIKGRVNQAESAISDKYEELKNSAKREYDDMKS